MANYPIVDWYGPHLQYLIVIVTLVTMVICGFAVTRYLRNQNREVPHSNEGVQTDFTSEPVSGGEPPASSSELVTLG